MRRIRFRCLAVSLSISAALTPQLATAASAIKGMTLEEKVAQLQAAAPAIPRLGVKGYNWWNEGLHGIARNGHATVFPQAIGLAATWDAELLQQVGDVVATEARAKYNAVGIDKDHGRYQGLTIWSPNINIFRDPRWGRGQETYGEDPYLTGTLATAFIKGLQGPDLAHPKTIASVKHLAVHSGPEAGRHGFDVDVSPYDLHATYLPAFRRTVVEGRVGSVMCAYNSLHGVPACANRTLLQTHLREAWGFKGYVVTDCDSVYDMANFHFYRPSMAENAAEALEAGTDLNCGNGYAQLTEAVRNKLVSRRLIDRALSRLWTARAKLGLDGTGSPHDAIAPDQVHTPAAAALALKAARESIVLLKNNGVLPLKPSARIAIVGPNADALTVLRGNYHGTAVSPVTPLVGLRRVIGPDRVRYAQGSGIAAGVPLIIPETNLRADAGEAGLIGEYFRTADFSGEPVLKRVDRTIEMDLQNAPPAPELAHGPYSIRWSGTLVPPAPGDYRLNIALERCFDCGNRHDTARLFIDDHAVIIADGDTQQLSASVHFDDASPRKIRLEFRHSGDDYGVRLQWQSPAAAQLAEAVQAAASADAVVAFVGLSPDIEGEELQILVPGFDHGDRTDLALPAAQENLLQALKSAGKPLVVVVLSGSAVALNWAATHADAVLQAWYPGEAGGTAIAETLLGHNNPSGRLPVTVYKSVQDLPPFIDYRMTGRTYRYFSGQPLYEFGHGLSYTTFAYSKLRLSSHEVAAGQHIRVSATVTNTGALAGDEVAQLYLLPPANEQGLLRELVGFHRVHLRPGESTDVTFELSPREMSMVDARGVRAQIATDLTLYVGGSQPSKSAGVSDKLRITSYQRLPN
jgi:beta-glucosidase